MLTITLPWPPSALSPNQRQHWSKLAKAKKMYRDACAWTAKAQGAVAMQEQHLRLALTFYPPSRRVYDLDNAMARMKSGLDGLADVLGVDDSRWSFGAIERADTIGGYVKVEVIPWKA